MQHFQSLIDESVRAVMAAFVEQIHKWAQVRGGVGRGGERKEKDIAGGEVGVGRGGERKEKDSRGGGECRKRGRGEWERGREERVERGREMVRGTECGERGVVVLNPDPLYSLVSRPCAPPSKKQSGERSRISWAYYPKVVMTNEIARLVLNT